MAIQEGKSPIKKSKKEAKVADKQPPADVKVSLEDKQKKKKNATEQVSLKRKANGESKAEPPQKQARKNSRVSDPFCILLHECPSSVTDDVIRKQYNGLALLRITRPVDFKTKESTGNVIVAFSNEYDTFKAQKISPKGPDGKCVKSVDYLLPFHSTNELNLKDVPESADKDAIISRYKSLGENAVKKFAWNKSKNGTYTAHIRFRTTALRQKAFNMEHGRKFGNITANDIRLKRVISVAYPPEVEDSFREKVIKDHYKDLGITQIVIERESNIAYVHFKSVKHAKKAAEITAPVVDGQPLKVERFIRNFRRGVSEGDSLTTKSDVQPPLKRKAEGTSKSEPPQKQARTERPSDGFSVLLHECPASVTDDVIREQYKGMEIQKISRPVDTRTKKPSGNVVVAFSNEYDSFKAQKICPKGPDGKCVKSVERMLPFHSTNQLILKDVPESADKDAIISRYKSLGEKAVRKYHWQQCKDKTSLVDIKFRTSELCQKAFTLEPYMENGQQIGNVTMNTSELESVISVAYPPKVQNSFREELIKEHYKALGSAAIQKIVIERESNLAYVYFDSVENANKAAKMTAPVVDGQILKVKKFLRS